MAPSITKKSSASDIRKWQENYNRTHGGEDLKVNGKLDTATKKALKADKVGAVLKTATEGDTENALDVAMGYMGQHAANLKKSGSPVGKAMEDWVPNSVNCANFVGGVLQVSGQISKKQHSANANGLFNNLKNDPNWEVTQGKPKAGDVVLLRTGPGANDRHIVIADGKGGYVGSNNRNADGSQRVTRGTFGSNIIGIAHFKGGPPAEGKIAPYGGDGGGQPVDGGKMPQGYDAPNESFSGPFMIPPVYAKNFNEIASMHPDMTLEQLMVLMNEHGLDIQKFFELNPHLKNVPLNTKIDASKLKLSDDSFKEGASTAGGLPKLMLAQPTMGGGEAYAAPAIGGSGFTVPGDMSADPDVVSVAAKHDPGAIAAVAQDGFADQIQPLEMPSVSIRA